MNKKLGNAIIVSSIGCLLSACAGIKTSVTEGIPPIPDNSYSLAGIPTTDLAPGTVFYKLNDGIVVIDVVQPVGSISSNSGVPSLVSNGTSSSSAQLGAALSIVGVITGNLNATASNKYSYKIEWDNITTDRVVVDEVIPGTTKLYSQYVADDYKQFMASDGSLTGKQLYLITSAIKATKISITVTGDNAAEIKGTGTVTVKANSSVTPNLDIATQGDQTLTISTGTLPKALYVSYQAVPLEINVIQQGIAGAGGAPVISLNGNPESIAPEQTSHITKVSRNQN